jgi:indolepyruvate ferredoxin oxidoreductase beta subunit
MKTTNILICGVGGQGILLAGELLGNIALESGFDVKKSEIHGMAQRGGSVVSHIRFGERIYSPTIKEREADFIMSFEKMETLRYIPYLKEDGIVIVNNQKISPTNTSIKASTYIENIEEHLNGKCKSIKTVDAIKVAEKVGNVKAANVVMIGALSKFLNFSASDWEKTFNFLIPKKYLNLNLSSFKIGQEL